MRPSIGQLGFTESTNEQVVGERGEHSPKSTTRRNPRLTIFSKFFFALRSHQSHKLKRRNSRERNPQQRRRTAFEPRRQNRPHQGPRARRGRGVQYRALSVWARR